MIATFHSKSLIFETFSKIAKPSVTVIEPELTVLQYSEILLTCTAKSFTEMTVKWIKAGNVLKEFKAR
jgi:hypothetical protein